jgi:hypothetical protein
LFFATVKKNLQMNNSESRTSASDSGEKNQNNNNQQNGTNTVKDPNDWTTGNEPMTGAQKSYLKTLSDTAGEPFDENLSKAEAAKRIDELQKNNKGNNKDSNSDTSNTVKDPDEWKTGDQEMTGAQRSYLKTLSDEAGESLDENLTKAEASKKIDDLQQKTGRGQ